MLCALATGCANTARLVPKTEVVVVVTDEQLTEKVAVPKVDVRVNEDLDRKALRMESALAECNARLDDVRAANVAALEDAKRIAKESQPSGSFWARLFGGGK